MPIPRYSTKLAILAALLVLVPMAGCVPWSRGIRSLDDTVTDWRDFVWGKRAFFQRYGFDASGPFQDGFLEGYHDILQGGDGCLPVVPPRRYWGWRFQSAGGQAAISDWFSGYSAGVEAAKEDGLSGVSCVPMSSQYNGTSDVPIQSMPSYEQEWPAETPGYRGEIPAPSVEPPSPDLKTGIISPYPGTVQPASVSQPIPYGSGIIVDPWVSETSATSRRGSTQPLSLSPVPVMRSPLNSPLLNQTSQDLPKPIQR